MINMFINQCCNKNHCNMNHCTYTMLVFPIKTRPKNKEKGKKGNGNFYNGAIKVILLKFNILTLYKSWGVPWEYIIVIILHCI